MHRSNRELLFHRAMCAVAVLVIAGSIGLPYLRPHPATPDQAPPLPAKKAECGADCACGRAAPAASRAPSPSATEDAKELARLKGSLAAAALAANESAAISMMRVIVSCEAQIQITGAIDVDGDGMGEYGYFGEMAGTAPLRVSVRGVTTVGNQRLDPPVLSKQSVVPGGTISRNGYLFRIYLPDSSGRGLPENAGGPAAKMPDADRSEVAWCAYAWPIERDVTGTRAFFVNQEGDIMVCPNTVRRYSGNQLSPEPGAVFEPSDSGSIMAHPATRVSGDGEAWTVLQ